MTHAGTGKSAITLMPVMLSATDALGLGGQVIGGAGVSTMITTI
jgi:hypothetical protein